MNNLFKAGLLMMVASTVQAKDCPQYMDYDLPKLHSNDTVNLCEIAKDKTLLVVNTASHCGYTRQFGGLESLHQQYQDKGLVVIGFASNDFDQEAKTEAEAARICKENFGVSFTMVAPSYVTGSLLTQFSGKLINKAKRQIGTSINTSLMLMGRW